MEALTTIEVLRRHVTQLACVEETETPFVSCYLSLEHGGDGCHKVIEARAASLRNTLKDGARIDFDGAIHQIENYLATQLRPDAKGVAVFARPPSGGAFFLPMQFAAPLPDWIVLGPTPNLFHLMALKDTYHRYIVLLATQASVRILEVNLGATTVQAWTIQPKLRERVGREWTKEHYESHRRERTARFLKEQVELLGRLMVAGKHTHLILAGDPHLTREIRHALPKAATSKLIDTIPAASRDAQADVVTATLSAFVEWEEQESQAVAARFVKGIRTQARAVAGPTACLEALRQRRADILLLARDIAPKPGWLCSSCGTIRTDRNVPDVCPECGIKEVHAIDTTETLVRLAGQQDCPVEVVDHCDPLMALGGVGCLTRY
jgi:rubrerythrin